MRSFGIALFVCCVCLAAAGCNRGAGGANMDETQKIEALISSVENLKDAKFIRNGKEYDSKAAADHMRKKWNYAKRHIKSARDFIELVASKSSESGEPYLIRLKDGKEVTSEEFLNGELDRIEHGKKAADGRFRLFPDVSLAIL